ncbi:hypothetical protein LCGC14_2440540 [marine sediment metagenome]|uniref:Uncharacterized protein n=1 Tax=marine sediment metagenome TaxID=412755 RepID=A0A0F9C6J9_9ZZZZ
MDNLFKDSSEKILIYLSVQTVEDPFEKNSSQSILPSLPIDAIVSDLGFSSIQWKMPGVLTSKAKEIIIKKKHENLLKLSYKIRIDGEDYQGWTISGRLQYRIEDEYLRAYVYLKQLSD